MKTLLHCLICFILFNSINAQSWIPQGPGLLPIGYTIWSISAANNSVVWATASLESVVSTPIPADHQLKVLRSIDGGLTWASHTLGTGIFSWDIYAVDANTAWITTLSFGNGIPNTLYKTEDGGLTWTNKLTDFSAGVYIRQFDEDHLLVQTNEYAARSEDGGENWILDTIQPYLPNEFNTLASGNNMVSFIGDTLWVGTSFGRIVRFTNYGADFEMIYTGTIFLVQALSFADHLRGMIFYYSNSTGEFGLVRTFDGGDTWELTPSKPQTTKEYNITHVPGTSSTFMAITDYYADDAEYFWTTDFGDTWIKGGDITDAQTNGIQFLNPTTGWAATGNITRADQPIAYRWLGDIFSGIKDDDKFLTGFEVSPNPASNMIRYRFDVEINHNDDKTPHEWSVLDLKGHVIGTGNTSSMELSIDNLPVGTYFLRIKSNDRVGTRMFVKVYGQ